MNVKSFKKGAVIFRQGDAGDCMYDIQFGRVGIFDHYGEPDEKKIAELFADQIFGEMGLLDHAPRSATAVALHTEGMVSKICGFIAIVLATINVIGGYLVTDRMLGMFKKKGDDKK